MCDEEDISSDSDDGDYIPSDCDVSEEEHSGEEEDVVALNAEAGKDAGTAGLGKHKRKKKESKSFARKRKGGIKIGDNEGDEDDAEDAENTELSEQIKEEAEAKTEEKEKKRVNDLWSSFMSDVGKPAKSPSVSKSAPSVSKTPESKPATESKSEETVTSETKPTASVFAPKEKKIAITREYDFAGESIKITKEVDINSKEAKEFEKEKESKDVQESEKSEPKGPSFLANIGIKKPPQAAGSGLGGLLNKLNKKPKIGTLEKSKLDWDSFKHSQGITEDLQIHTRGKDSYCDRMRFLERTDVRQFEIEKDLRKTGKR